MEWLDTILAPVNFINFFSGVIILITNLFIKRKDLH